MALYLDHNMTNNPIEKVLRALITQIVADPPLQFRLTYTHSILGKRGIYANM